MCCTAAFFCSCFEMASSDVTCATPPAPTDDDDDDDDDDDPVPLLPPLLLPRDEEEATAADDAARRLPCSGDMTSCAPPLLLSSLCSLLTARSSRLRAAAPLRGLGREEAAAEGEGADASEVSEEDRGNVPAVADAPRRR